MNRIVYLLGAPLMALFLTACGSTGSNQIPIKTSHTDTLNDDCAIMRKVTFTQGDEVIRVDNEVVGFSELCGNHQLLAKLVNSEMNDPYMEAFMTTSTVVMLAEASPEFKKSLIMALSKYNITVGDLEDRKKLDDEIQSAKATPGVQCVKIGEPKQLYCE